LVQEILASVPDLVVRPWETHDLASLGEETRGKPEVLAVAQKRAYLGEDSSYSASSSQDLGTH
jgi:hypothetical protein